MANNNDKKILNVPNLRFPEFSGEWKECCIRDFGTVITGNTPPTKNEEYYSNGIKLWASPADLGKDKYVIDTNTKLSQSGFERTRILPTGSVLVTCIGSTIGKMGMAKYEMSINQQINSVVVDAFTDRNFAYYAIQNAFPRYLSEVAVQAVPILSKSNFEKLPNYKPTLQEQKKLGAFIDLLDQRISTQNKIIEDLKSLIKGAYKNTFSSLDGRKRKLGDICHIVKGQQVNGEFLTNMGQYYVMNGGTEPSGFYHKFNTPANTISISEGGNSCGYIQFNGAPFWSGGHCYTLQSLDIDVNYLYHFLKSKELDVMNLRIGSGLPNIQKKDLACFQVIVPKQSTQNKIRNGFNAIANKIKLERKLVCAYEMQKQYMLRSMFI